MSDVNFTLYEDLRNALKYVEKTGIFTWKDPVPCGRVKPGQVAGCLSKSTGYIYIRIKGRLYAAHRLAWLYVNGSLPNDGIDHIDGIKTNNSISNLRIAPQVLNQQNLKKAKSHSSTGLLGIVLDKRRNKWRAEIQANKKRSFLGYFATKEEAHQAYIIAKRNLHAYGTL